MATKQQKWWLIVLSVVFACFLLLHALNVLTILTGLISVGLAVSLAHNILR